MSQLPLRYKTRRPKSPPPIKSPGALSGAALRQEDKMSEVKYEGEPKVVEESGPPTIDIQQESLAEDSKE